MPQVQVFLVRLSKKLRRRKGSCCRRDAYELESMKMGYLQFFLVAQLATASIASAEGSLQSPRTAPKFGIDAPSPSMLRVIVESGGFVEFEREPSIARRNIDRDAKGRAVERHDALAAKLYRYRARERAVTGAPAGRWSGWKYIRTACAPTEAPATPRMVKVQADSDYVISLAWVSQDRLADGFLLERCIPDGPCAAAALLNPDVLAFDYHTLGARQFRIAAFNAIGTSSFSARTAVVGENVPIKQSTDQVLVPADSHAARLIRRRRAEDFGAHSYCTTPEQLIHEGYVLAGIKGLSDLYQGPESCGTGGCIFTIYTTVDGCYTTSESETVLASTAPFSGLDNDSPGVVVTNSSGSAYEGGIIIYYGADQVDSYRWRSFDQTVDRIPPFGEYGSYQEPDSEN